MNIKSVAKDITDIFEQIRDNYHEYCYDGDYSYLMDKKLEAKIKLLIIYLEENNLQKYITEITSYLPVQGNAEGLIEFLEPIINDILMFEKWNDPIKKESIITSIAYDMQEKYTFTEIDIIFKGLNIKYGDEYKEWNSKRVYVQKVLAEANTDKIIKLAQKLEILTETIEIGDAIEKLSNDFIIQQINKCNIKINEEDFDGAITNARSLVEEILLSIEEKIKGERQDYDGKIEGLYKRVRKLINMDPNKDTNNSINEILNGFISIIAGMSSISNKMGDRHAITYKPDKRHALLIVNASMTISKFLIESYDYQNN